MKKKSIIDGNDLLIRFERVIKEPIMERNVAPNEFKYNKTYIMKQKITLLEIAAFSVIITACLLTLCLITLTIYNTFSK